MERDKDNFQSGSSGGGGKRGYGVRPSFLFPHGDDESPPSTSGESRENKNISESDQDKPDANENENVIDWIDGRGTGFELVRGYNDCDESDDSSSTCSSDQEYESNLEVYDKRADNLELDDQQDAYGYAAFVAYSGFIGYPNVQGGYGFAGYIGAPVHPQGGLAMRMNENNAIEYNVRPGVINEVHGAVPGDHGANNALVQVQGGEIGEIYNIRQERNDMNHLRDGCIFYYATMTAYAHRRLDGEILSEMLSLRDSHVFNIIQSTDYSNAIGQICNNPDLAEAMVSHIDCFKALLNRNLPLAFTKQVACINAIMKLLNDPYGMREEWTYPVINTVTYDLRIISMKISASGRDTINVPYNWVVNSLTCFFHSAVCQCHPGKAYRTRNFYKRF